jgi:hypothetical protein
VERAAPLSAEQGAQGNAYIKIATFNVNGINGRLPGLLEWLAKELLGIAWLQALVQSSHSQRCDGGCEPDHSPWVR